MRSLYWNIEVFVALAVCKQLPVCIPAACAITVQNHAIDAKFLATVDVPLCVIPDS